MPHEPTRGWMGYDVDDGALSRPGVPRERPDREHGLARRPEQQRGVELLSREGLRWATPVFGTAQPAHGLAGLLRRAAYRRPEHASSRWALLLAGDRIDVLAGRVARNLWLVPVLVALAGGFLATTWAVGSPRRHAR